MPETDATIAVLHEHVIVLRGIVERLAMRFTAVETRLTAQDVRLIQIQQTLAAIKDLLERGNAQGP